jgi:hypothetical protein
MYRSSVLLDRVLLISIYNIKTRKIQYYMICIQFVEVQYPKMNGFASNPATRAPVKNSRREGFSSKSSQKNERGAMPILAF